MQKSKIGIGLLFWTFAIFFLAGAFYYFAVATEKREFGNPEVIDVPSNDEIKVEINEQTKREEVSVEFIPKAPSMDIMKKRGCIADGLLNGHGGNTKKIIKMINRSECQYLHRSIETWLEAPDFEEIERNKREIIKQDMVFGMFLAEAIDTKADYYFPDENRKFDFSKMCRRGSKNFWGEHTCKPSFDRKEYRNYLGYITKRAMDLGVQNFMFGQVYYQDDLDEPRAAEIIREMKEYAADKKMQIVVGAQTNDITEESYLRVFDYIEGGVGLSIEGEFEDGPCFSRWWKKPGDWCWALLWHERYAASANNVFIHLDWSGRNNDDMNTFSKMDDELRAKTLERLYTYFTDKEHGFLMPMLAVLPKDSEGCYGGKRGFYSSDNDYSCADENAINEIMKKGRQKSNN